MQMTSFIRSAVVLALALFGLAQQAQAQIFTPTFMAPRSSSDIGIYLNDGPGDFSVEGIWRRAFGGYDLGVRAGLADIDDLALLIGGELRNPLEIGAPIDLAVTGHVQGAIGDVSAVGFALGLSVGYTFDAPPLAFTPYLHPRVALINGFGPSDDFDLELLADFGFDLRISPRLDLRFGIAFDDDSNTDWGVGLAWR